MEATMENLAKWIDELTGEIEQIKKRLGSVGSTVTITPSLESGTKVADYSIDDTNGSLYAPTPPDAVTITPALGSGTKVADYTIGETSGSLFAPSGLDIAFDDSNPIKIGTLGNDNVMLKTVKYTTTIGMGADFSIALGTGTIKEILSLSVVGVSGSGSQYFQGSTFTIPATNKSVDNIYNIDGVRVDGTTLYGHTNSGTQLSQVRVMIIYTQTPPSNSKAKKTKKESEV